MNSAISTLSALEESLLTKFRKLGIQTPLDLLHYYPRDHIIYRRCEIAELKLNSNAIVTGRIQKHRIISGKQRGLTLQTWTIVDELENAIQITQFHYGSRFQSIRWRYEQQQLYKIGTAIAVTGQVKFDDFSQAFMIVAATVEIIDVPSAAKRLIIQTIYP